MYTAVYACPATEPSTLRYIASQDHGHKAHTMLMQMLNYPGRYHQGYRLNSMQDHLGLVVGVFSIAAHSAVCALCLLPWFQRQITSVRTCCTFCAPVDKKYCRNVCICLNNNHQDHLLLQCLWLPYSARHNNHMGAYPCCSLDLQF